MAVTVTVLDDVVDIGLTGFDTALCFSKGVRLAMTEITGARVAPRNGLLREVGWRLGGGYWPNALATGWYTWRKRKGYRQLWCTYRDKEVLVIDTTRLKPGRLVLQVPDRAEQAAAINARLTVLP